MPDGQGSCHVYFDDQKMVVTATQSGLLTLHVIHDLGVSDAELGRSIIGAWDQYETGDPDSPSHEERDMSWTPVRELFDVDWHVRVREVGANSRGSRVWIVPSEWKAVHRDYLGREHHVVLPDDYDPESLGRAVRVAMSRTLS